MYRGMGRNSKLENEMQASNIARVFTNEIDNTTVCFETTDGRIFHVVRQPTKSLRFEIFEKNQAHDGFVDYVVGFRLLKAGWVAYGRNGKKIGFVDSSTSVVNATARLVETGVADSLLAAYKG